MWWTQNALWLGVVYPDFKKRVHDTEWNLLRQWSVLHILCFLGPPERNLGGSQTLNKLILQI
jgi:hypothetical protein